MKPFIDAMVVANKLQVPHASFGKFMVRKLLPLARDHLIDLQTVRRAYDSGDEVFNELDIREVCVKSIFEHWFAWKLDGDEAEKIDYMCTLAEMRENIPELDADLHKAVDDKDEWLKGAKKRRQEKDQQNSDEAGTGGAEGGNDDWAAHNAGAAGGGEDAWANPQAGASDGGNDWMNENAGDGAATGGWAAEGHAGPAKGPIDWAGDVDNSANDGFGGGGGSGNWADDMNDNDVSQSTQNFNPAPIPAGGGW